MNRNNNSAVIRRLAKRGYQAKGTKNNLAIIAIILTSVMFATIFTIGFSAVDTIGAVGIGFGSEGTILGVSVISIILISGYLIISNVFEVSITQDIQYYGSLKTIGTTKDQIVRIITYQALRMSVIGIPIGVAIGYVIGMLIVPKILVSLGSAIRISIHPFLFIGAIVFTLVTVLFSTRKPAKAAGSISPIQALKYVNGESQSKAQEKKTMPHISPKGIALAHIKQNKKITLKVVISIVLGLTLMNTFYVYQNSYDKQGYVDSFINSDIAITTTDSTQSITQKEISTISNLENVEEVGSILYSEIQIPFAPEVVDRLVTYYENNEIAMSWIEEEPAVSKQYQDIKNNGKSTVSIYGADALGAMQGAITDGEYDATKFQNGKYVMVFQNDNDYDAVFHNVGETITIAGQEYEIMAFINPTSTVFDDFFPHAIIPQDNSMHISFMISQENYKDLELEPFTMGVYVNAEKEAAQLYDEISKNISNHEITSREIFTADFYSQTLAQVIMGYTLGFIMAIVGILNFINSMLNSIITRKREFAVLESIGMTKKQIRTMLIFEGQFYAISSILISLVLATIVANTLIANIISNSWIAAYRFTLFPFVIITPLLILLAYQIPMICYRGTQQKSLVERLRETTN